MKLIIGLNLGSTSSEVGILNGNEELKKHKFYHSENELSLSIEDQMPFRLNAIKSWLDEEKIDLENCTAIVSRGGRLQQIPSGIYSVNEQLLNDSKKTTDGDHASRLSVLIGKELSELARCPIFVVDPISVDEFTDISRISGLAGIERKSLGHALNSKYVAKKMAKSLNIDYMRARFLICHMGGGATISLHINGKMVDLINDFEGAMTPERSGGLATTELLKLCANNDIEKVSRLVEGSGGIYSYLGIKDFEKLEMMADSGDKKARLLLDAYIYQQKKSIGALFSVADYNIDGIALTGGISHSKSVCEELNRTFSPFTKVMTYPGSFEMEAMIEETVNALEGKTAIKEYPTGREQ